MRVRRLVVVVVVVVRAMPMVPVPTAVLMPVVPEFGFVEQKEKHQTEQQGQEQLVRTGLTFEGLG